MKNIWAVLGLCLLSMSANAALLSRAGGLAYYDDVLNITWLANANLADTNDFGVTGIFADGSMNLATANDWIAAMNASSYLGMNGWRLPVVNDSGTPGCNFAYSGTDCGYNVNLSTGEMAHLYYATLGNLAYCTTGGSCPQSGWGLSNAGPFSNIQAYDYWVGTPYSGPVIGGAWLFAFDSGSQWVHNTSDFVYAWAVHDGDIAAVPVPGALWLFGSALGVMGWLRRKARC